MCSSDLPTYRLRDVCETVATYDENFWNNGHSPRIIVFDDSSVANHEKYYPLLEKTRTWSDVFYVGPKEKEAFSLLLHKRLRDRKLEAAVRNLDSPARPRGIAIATVGAPGDRPEARWRPESIPHMRVTVPLSVRDSAATASRSFNCDEIPYAP